MNFGEDSRSRGVIKSIPRGIEEWKKVRDLEDRGTRNSSCHPYLGWHHWNLNQTRGRRHPWQQLGCRSSQPLGKSSRRCQARHKIPPWGQRGWAGTEEGSTTKGWPQLRSSGREPMGSLFGDGRIKKLCVHQDKLYHRFHRLSQKQRSDPSRARGAQRYGAVLDRAMERCPLPDQRWTKWHWNWWHQLWEWQLATPKGTPNVSPVRLLWQREHPLLPRLAQTMWQRRLKTQLDWSWHVSRCGSTTKAHENQYERLSNSLKQWRNRTFMEKR